MSAPTMDLTVAAPPVAAEERRARRLRAAFWLYAGHLFAVFALALSNGLMGLAGLATAWASPWREVPWRRYAPILIPLATYYLLLVLSVIASYEPEPSFGELGDIARLATLAFALFLVRGENGVRRVVGGLLLIASLLAFGGLVELLAGGGDIDHRIRGPFSHYMTYTGVLLMCDLLLLARISTPGGLRRGWSWAGFVVINAAILGTLTRGAWVALVVTAIGFLVFRTAARGRLPRWLLAAVPVALLGVAFAPVPLVHRALSIADLRDTSNYDRLCMLQAGFAMVAERPLLGLGPDVVKRRYPIYRNDTAPRLTVPHLHNSFLQLAAERGLLSLAVYVWMMCATLRQAWRGYKSEGGWLGGRADLFLGAILALIAFNIAGLFEDNWRDAEVQRVALFLMALPYCLAAPKRVDSP
jgi:O-antigen ligase